MRTHLKTLAVAGLTLALLGWFFRQADLSQVWREIREAKPWALALLLGVTGLTYLLRALRWQFLLRPIGPTRLRRRSGRPSSALPPTPCCRCGPARSSGRICWRAARG